MIVLTRLFGTVTKPLLLQEQICKETPFAKLRSEWVKYVPKCGRTIVGDTELPVGNRCGYTF